MPIWRLSLTWLDLCGAPSEAWRRLLHLHRSATVCAVPELARDRERGGPAYPFAAEDNATAVGAVPMPGWLCRHTEQDRLARSPKT